MTTHAHNGQDHDHNGQDQNHDHSDPSIAVKEMAEACVKFVDSLSADQKAKTIYHFNDGERIFWYYPPMNRHGLPLRDMDENQRTLAYALMASGLSKTAATRVHQIIEHELILGSMEKTAGIRSFVRDPELYYWTVFGDPLGEDPWGWRIEGHHISIHMHIYKGEVISTTPFLRLQPGSCAGRTPERWTQHPRQPRSPGPRACQQSRFQPTLDSRNR